MAGLTFLDLMLAEALAAGLARDSIRAERRPPPDNFFLLPSDPAAWRKVQEASKKENMVVCIEITNDTTENCRRVQTIFMDMAREFEGIPFFRVIIRPGATFDELRRDIGGVQYTPTIVAVFFGSGSVSRAKYEGEAEVRNGISTGQIEGVIKELVNRRVKLKMAEKVAGDLAEGLAQQVRTQISDKEKRMRDEYELKLQRQMAEKEEEFKKLEEEKKKKEEEEEHQKDLKRRQANERIRKERPQHLEELLKMDLDSSSIRDIKAIMIKLGVSPHDCFERGDLKKKLIENVPELRIKISSSSPQKSESNSRSNSVSSDGSYDPLGVGIDSNEIRSLRKELSTKKNELEQVNLQLRAMTTRANKAESSVLSFQNTVSSLKIQVSSLQQEKKTLLNNQNPVPLPRATGSDSNKVKELETKLLETRMLYTTNIQDFEIMGLIYEAGTEDGCESLIVRVKCTKPCIPNKERTYAMKVLTNYFKTQTQTQVRQDHQNEYQVLCQLPPHENIIHMWAFFFDRLNPEVSSLFKKAGKNARTMSLFILMDEYPSSMAEQLKQLIENRGPMTSKVLSWFKDLLSGLVFLEEHCVVHRDLKLDNLLITSDGKLVISDFGKAIEMDMDTAFKMKHQHGLDTGGNGAHLAPEILNSKPGPRSYLNYSKQPVWAAGVLAYELAGHPSPFKAGTIDQRGYADDELPPLKFTYCKNSIHCEQLPPEFTRLVQSMLQPSPSDRPSLKECLSKISKMQ